MSLKLKCPETDKETISDNLSVLYENLPESARDGFFELEVPVNDPPPAIIISVGFVFRISESLRE